ncbi:hypothetical protein CYMTET_46581 [Cymbomonas tetramitiformis]|uniref:Reverse transcriptase domain-containing protein n=1 Tax=Cymbomonas tetramitiformis TaxID=36881 RepID=A0AAE0BW00_9CHLO|nr:hypothetical protein CYMTET_46581 [Cymbomonas tetramitiformis]
MFGGHPDFTEENWDEMRAIIRRCKYCFANKPQDIKGYHGNAEHNTFSIPFKDDSNSHKVAYQKARKYSPGEQEVINIHCKELLERYGFIDPASKHCKHASNVVVAGKNDHETGLWAQTRFCVDLRMCNRLSLEDNTVPHSPEDLYQRVAKAQFKTTLDATKAFHQIPMTTDEDRDTTAFWWGKRLYRYTSMPFGAAGATAAFVRVMDFYEQGALTHCIVCYVDDVVMYSDTAAQHLKDVEAVRRTLGDAGIRIHLGKSTFGSSTVDFLGFRIGYNTIDAEEAKSKAIQELPKPGDKTGLRSIVGLMNCYNCLVGEIGGPDYSEFARPLNDVLKKEKDEDGVEHICVAISRSLGKTAERQYASFQGEMLVVVWDVRTLRQYLHGVHFTLVTGHLPLTTLMEKADLQATYLERHKRGFCDSMCLQVMEDPPVGDEADPEFQTREDYDVPRGRLSAWCSAGLLEMPLRNGVKVKKYMYQDILVAARAVASARCFALSRFYPDLFSTAAIKLDQLPPQPRAGTKMREQVFPHIVDVVGQPMSVDASQAGSYAHRLRAYYWSNLFQNSQFDVVMARVKRPDDRLVFSILGEGWEPREAIATDQAPYHVTNVKGDLMRALPTILVTQNSRASRAPRMGSLVRSDKTPKCREPDLDEKAWSMGYVAAELRSADSLDDRKLAEERREEHEDIHNAEWCLKWLKSRGTMALPVEVAGSVDE